MPRRRLRVAWLRGPDGGRLGHGKRDARLTRQLGPRRCPFPQRAIKTDDEALIYMRYEGIAAGDALPRVLGAEAVPPAGYYFRTTPYFETGSDKYAWLN